MDFRAVAFAGLFMLANCTPGMGLHGRPPELVRGLTWSNDIPHPELTTRLQERFPPGSSENTLIAELRRQGFDINVAESKASTDWADIVCLYVVAVDWNASEGEIAHIDGWYGTGCL